MEIFVCFYNLHSLSPSQDSISNRNIAKYDKHELIDIGKKVRNNLRLGTLMPSIIHRVRWLRIQKKHQRGKLGGCNNKLLLGDDNNKNRGTNLDLLRPLNIADTTKEHKDYIKFGLANVQSLGNKIGQVHESIFDWDLDVCALCETWLTDTEDDKIWIRSSQINRDGLIAYNTNRKGKRGGGLALVVNAHLQCCVMEQYNKLVYTSFEFGIWKLIFNNTSVSILLIYRPPGIPYTLITPFTDEFLDLMTKLMESLKNLLILGDFNIHINNEEDPDAIQFYETMAAFGFDQYVKDSTCKQGNILDHIYLEENKSVKLLNISTGDFISDHKWITFQLNIEKPKVIRKRVLSRNFRKVNTSDFFKDLAVNDIVDTHLNSDLGELLQCYTDRLNTAVDKHAPTKIRRIKFKERRPWYGDNLLQQKRIVRSWEKVWRKYSNSHHWIALKVERSKYKKMLSQAKKEYFSNQIIKNKGNTKAFYQIVGDLMGDKTLNSLPPGYTDEEQAAEFSDFFYNKVETIRKDLEKHSTYMGHVQQIGGNMECFRPINGEELRKIIGKMQTKSCKLHLVTTKFLKENLNEFLPVLLHIVNTSLMSGEFSDDWKLALVKPLIKNINGELERKNYRLVSNLSFISKIVERAGMVQIMDHCNSQKLIPSFQSAYRKNYSCETCILKIVNDILWSMENKKVSILVALDLSAAFDTVNHEILLKVLEHRFGITHMALNWCCTYLSNRKCKVIIGNSEFRN